MRWWSSGGRREYPWRNTRDPYRILIAEILLHRTRAEQVVPIYERFLATYPNLHLLANSSADALEHAFRSVGLRWRWRLLTSMAQELESKYSAEIPEDKNDLLSLPGVSEYIASAMRCFAYQEQDVLLDTNTVRIAGRLFGMRITDGSRRSRAFAEVLGDLRGDALCRDFNFALIDFAAKICKAKKPLHDICPVRMYCSFNKEAGT